MKRILVIAIMAIVCATALFATDSTIWECAFAQKDKTFVCYQSEDVSMQKAYLLNNGYDVDVVTGDNETLFEEGLYRGADFRCSLNENLCDVQIFLEAGDGWGLTVISTDFDEYEVLTEREWA